MTELTQTQRLQNALKYKKVAHYYHTVKDTYRVGVLGICPTEGTDWGGYNLLLASSGKTLEEAKANLEDLCRKECVPGFNIDEWKEDDCCPLVYNHHVGSTCGCCGQHG